MANQNSLCVAIDLGTTNSLIATCRYQNGKISTPVKNTSRIVDNKGTKRNNQLLPSFVYYPQIANGEETTPIVGDFAKSQYFSLPFRVSKSIKSQMGNSKVTGLQDGITDKTPEEVSSKIIKHLIDDLKKHYNETIKDVVITVPASFDPAQRLATLRAAEIAGIDVKNDDGSYNQDILLSEPEAVMYNVLNQIKKGEYDANLDFEEEKIVLVFDIGGGTLDITIHKVKTDIENPDVLDMELLATNRFTPVAGDTFDKYVANIMYEQYINSYMEQLPEAVPHIKEKKDILLPSLQVYSEELKIDINNRYDDVIYRKRTLQDDAEFECGGIMPNAYTYNGLFTKKEYEDIVSPLLGLNYKYEDYKTIDGKRQTEDIIWPILDVLRKASKKLNKEDIKIDSVIMSGGMSRLYLIKNRLEEFFGFNVISTSNPDTAVVEGGVVYHFHQHQDSELMKRLHEKEESKFDYIDSTYTSSTNLQNHTEISPSVFIKNAKSILSDPIYLGLKAGANSQIADEGQELPYISNMITGFRIEKGQNKICIPIQKKGINPGEFVTIASGIISFKTLPKTDMPVALKFEISKNQIITIEAWMCSDEYGLNPIEKGVVSISFEKETTTNKGLRTKIIPPAGSRLVPCNEVSSLCNLCKQRKSPDVIKSKKNTITSCSNPEDFAEPILNAIEQNIDSVYICHHIIPLARRLSKFWNDRQKKRLVKLCFDIILPKIYGLSINKDIWNSVYNETILTIGLLGTKDDAQKLYCSILIDDQVHRNALIHIFSYHGINVDWIENNFFCNEIEAYRWIGLAINRSESLDLTVKVNKIVNKLIDALSFGYENKNLMISSIISLGLICDKKHNEFSKISNDLYDKVERAIEKLYRIYPQDFIDYFNKTILVALKLIRGQDLNLIEEEYLLSLYQG